MTLLATAWHDAVLWFGALCAAIIAIITCAVLVARLPPVRWLWRRLVAEPAGGWFRHQVRAEVEDITAQVTKNGGASLRDAIDRIEKRLNERLDEGDGRMGDLEEMVAEIRAWIRSHDPDLHVTVAGDLTIRDTDRDDDPVDD